MIVVPVVIRTLEIHQRMNERERTETIQTTAQLHSARILMESPGI